MDSRGNEIFFRKGVNRERLDVFKTYSLHIKGNEDANAEEKYIISRKGAQSYLINIITQACSKWNLNIDLKNANLSSLQTIDEFKFKCHYWYESTDRKERKVHTGLVVLGILTPENGSPVINSYNGTHFRPAEKKHFRYPKFH